MVRFVQERYLPPNKLSLRTFILVDPIEKLPEGIAFSNQSARGGGCWVFGELGTKAFLKNNNLELLVRSHEVCIHLSINQL